MGKTKFIRYRGVKKRRKTKPISVLVAAKDLSLSARARPTNTDDKDGSSTSARKLEYFHLTLDGMIERVSQKEETSSNDCFLLVQKSSVSQLISSLCCPYCKQTGIVFNTYDEKHKGFCAKGYIYCRGCELVIAEEYLSEKAVETASANEPFEINVRAVFAFMGIGCGFNAIKDWTTMINLPNCLGKFAYQGLKEKIIIGSKETFNELSMESVAIIRQKYEDIGILPDKDNILDVAVSYDGTWQKKGHSSHNGAAVAVEILTGLPVDYEVLSNFCHQCLKAPAKDDIAYKEWQAKHSRKCGKNYDGSANSMEQECARLIWQRSVRKFGLRYTTILSDGDSKSFSLLNDMNVYGGDVQIMKEECVNHVSK